MIIDHGPLSGGIFSWIHAMVLVGYDKDSDDGRTVWIFKNSWGDWGDAGYLYFKGEISDIGWTHALLYPVFSELTPYDISVLIMMGMVIIIGEFPPIRPPPALKEYLYLKTATTVMLLWDPLPHTAAVWKMTMMRTSFL